MGRHESLGRAAGAAESTGAAEALGRFRGAKGKRSDGLQAKSLNGVRHLC